MAGHTALLFHSGNVEDHTRGCILLGQYPAKLMGERAVLNSGTTFKKFMALMGNTQEFILQIINLF